MYAIIEDSGTQFKVTSGDRIRIDAVKGRLDLLIGNAELRKRKAKSPKRPRLSGALEKYAAQVGSAHLGAVTHSGGKPSVR